MKTAMKILMSEINVAYVDNADNKIDKVFNGLVETIIKRCTELLEKEKQQIIDAWEDGSIPDSSDDATLSGDEYYTKTYTT